MENLKIELDKTKYPDERKNNIEELDKFFKENGYDTLDKVLELKSYYDDELDELDIEDYDLTSDKDKFILELFKKFDEDTILDYFQYFGVFEVIYHIPEYYILSDYSCNSLPTLHKLGVAICDYAEYELYYVPSTGQIIEFRDSDDSKAFREVYSNKDDLYFLNNVLHVKLIPVNRVTQE